MSKSRAYKVYLGIVILIIFTFTFLMYSLRWSNYTGADGIDLSAINIDSAQKVLEHPATRLLTIREIKNYISQYPTPDYLFLKKKEVRKLLLNQLKQANSQGNNEWLDMEKQLENTQNDSALINTIFFLLELSDTIVYVNQRSHNLFENHFYPRVSDKSDDSLPGNFPPLKILMAEDTISGSQISKIYNIDGVVPFLLYTSESQNY